MTTPATGSLWGTYLRDSKDLPESERRALDAAEAMIHEMFGISPAFYVRANESPRAAKLEHVIAALVLRRGEWEQNEDRALG